MPFTVRVKTFYANSMLAQQSQPGFDQVKTTAGFGFAMWWCEVPRETGMNRIDMPSAIIEVVTNGGSLGTFLASGWMDQPQPFTFNHRTYQMLLRLERYYLPFSLHLIEFRHDKYPGTDIPKKFLQPCPVAKPGDGEDRAGADFHEQSRATPVKHFTRQALTPTTKAACSRW